MKIKPETVTLTICDEAFYKYLNPTYLAETAKVLESEISRPDVREWIEISPLSVDNYAKLRHLLMVLRKSIPTVPRRLTWRERITGRVQA
jgi:hypothetical protein